MEDIIREVIEAGMGNVIDRRRDPVVMSDEVYQIKCAKLTECEEKYMELDLPKDVLKIIDDYIFYCEAMYGRVNDLCYMAGMRDSILLLNQFGLLKDKMD